MFYLTQLPSNLANVQAVAAFVVVAAVCLFQWSRRPNLKYPPGPRGLPIVGNLYQLGKQNFEEWGDKYGDMMYLQAFSQGILLINSHTAAVDLLDRRSAIYSDRPSFIVINALTRGLFLGAASYGDVWRRMRRGGHECLSKSAVGRYHHAQEKEALLFTENLLDDSKDWRKEVSRSSISLLLSAVYDIPPTLSFEDPLIKKFTTFDDFIIEAAYPGNYLVEFFGFMKYLPATFAPWKGAAEKSFSEFSAFFDGLCKNIVKHIDDGDQKPGIAGYVIREQKRLGLSDAETAWLPATFANGSASVAEALLWFFLAMVAYPDKQKLCQDELDAVVGRSRMPTVEDSVNLPYMKATIRELLRWRPISPLGTQHVTRQDDWYQGYFIPKGTMCFAHIWLMNRDKKIYGEDAEEFNPGRFLDKDEKFVPIIGETKDGYLESEGHVAYGFGPRICPGRYFANDALFIMAARLLWATSISPVIDEGTGKPLLPDLKDTVGNSLTMRPPSFDIVVEPRFTEAATMVAQTKELFG